MSITVNFLLRYRVKATNRDISHFNMYSLREITTANDKSLDIRFLNSKVKVKRRNDNEWPKKYRVTGQDYIIWRNLLPWIFPTSNYKIEIPLWIFLPKEKIIQSVENSSYQLIENSCTNYQIMLLGTCTWKEQTYTIHTILHI